jgi:hypothetical protein
MATWDELHFDSYVRTPHGFGRVIGRLVMYGEPEGVLVALSKHRYGGRKPIPGVRYAELFAVEDVEVVEG